MSQLEVSLNTTSGGTASVYFTLGERVTCRKLTKMLKTYMGVKGSIYFYFNGGAHLSDDTIISSYTKLTAVVI